VCATCHFEICGQLNAEIAAEQQRLAAYRVTLARVAESADSDVVVATQQPAHVDGRRQQSIELLAMREAELQARQEQLIKVLDAVQGDLHQVRQQTARHFDELQSAYVRERDLELQIFQKRERYAAFREALAAAQNAATMREAQVRQLKSVRVHLDLFPIVQCEIGGVLTNMMSISGQRLGRFPGVPIDWEEINAALGECALLLDNIAAAAGAPNVRARVIPLGSRSLVQLLPADAQAFDDRIDLSSTRLFALYGNDERAAFASSGSSTLSSKVGGLLSSAASLFSSFAPATAKQAVASPLLSSRRGIDTSRRAGDDALMTSSVPLDASVGPIEGVRERDTRTEFDCAIALLLCCVDDVAQFVRQSKPQFSSDWKEIELVPNEADDRGTVAEGVPVVRIGNRKARASRADMKEWTHAMKYLLHDLLQLLAFVSSPIGKQTKVQRSS
jgi:hypothetical protein